MSVDADYYNKGILMEHQVPESRETKFTFHNGASRIIATSYPPDWFWRVSYQVISDKYGVFPQLNDTEGPHASYQKAIERGLRLGSVWLGILGMKK